MQSQTHRKMMTESHGFSKPPVPDKGDEGILRDSDFLTGVLAGADERYDRRYRLKSLGYDISKVEHKVIEPCNIEKEDLYSGNRKKALSEARSLFCHWCVCVSLGRA